MNSTGAEVRNKKPIRAHQKTTKGHKEIMNYHRAHTPDHRDNWEITVVIFTVVNWKIEK